MNRLKELRKEKKLTQKELADIIGTTKLTISNWENGKHSINSNKADKLSSFFDVSVGYLLGTSNKNYNETKIIQHEYTNTIIDNTAINHFNKITDKSYSDNMSSKFSNLYFDNLEAILKYLELLKETVKLTNLDEEQILDAIDRITKMIQNQDEIAQLYIDAQVAKMHNDRIKQEINKTKESK